MVTGIISLAGSLLGLIFWMIQKDDRDAHDPVLQNKKSYERIDREIAARQPDAGLSYDLDTLARLQRNQGH